VFTRPATLGETKVKLKKRRRKGNSMASTLSSDADERPVAIVGAGTLGRRIAAVYAAGGSDVQIFDTSGEQCEAANEYVADHLDETRRILGLDGARTGRVEVFDQLASAVHGAWMVIEAVPERLDLKRQIFAQLDELADADAILASNSSSLPTSQLIDGVKHPERVLNTHYQQPPELNAVELMSSGETDESLIDALMEKIPQYGLKPFRVRRESDGFIFNRVWAAIKRECLLVVAEGVATSEDVDEMWQIFTKPGIPPFRLMDRAGLDVLLNIEEHYALIRPHLPEEPRTLLREYVEQGKLGLKSGRGFYDDYSS
jgi:3-hydroxybutyryl-CoA dehydrogenase